MKNVILNGNVHLAGGKVLPVGGCVSISDAERSRMDPDGFYFSDAPADAVPSDVIGADPVDLTAVEKPSKSSKK